MIVVETLATAASVFVTLVGLVSLFVFVMWWLDFKHDLGITSTFSRSSEDRHLFKGWTPAMWWRFLLARSRVMLIACSVTANLVYVAGNDRVDVYTGDPNLMPPLLIFTGVYLVLTLVSKAMYMRLKLLEARGSRTKQQAPTS